MTLKKKQFSDDEIPLFDNVVLYKRGEFWQMRMWLPNEHKYARFSLKTRSKSTAIDKAESHFYELKVMEKQVKSYFSITTKIGVEMFLEYKKKEIGTHIVVGRYKTISTHLKHLLSQLFKMSNSFFIFFCSLAFLNFHSFAQTTPESVELAKKIPIADAHMHTYFRGGPSSDAFLEQMDKNNVKWGGAVGDYRADVADKLKNRYIPAIGQMEFMEVFFSRGVSGLVDDENWTFKRLFKNAEEQFSNGTIKGFGELHTNNNSSGPVNIRRTIRTDSPAVRNMYAIANKYNGFVQLHSQHDENFTIDILKLSAEFPNTITVLSHCLPLSQPKDLANLFSQRKNIVCEMSATGSAHNKILGLNRPARAFDDNGLRPAWKNLIETYPDQIMVGTDACCGWFNSYSDMVIEIRENLLPYLSTELMEKIAYKNAVRIFKLKE